MFRFRLCEGLIITSFTKYEEQKRLFEKHLSKSLEQYTKYKLFGQETGGEERFNGKTYKTPSNIYIYICLLSDLYVKMKLGYVRDCLREKDFDVTSFLKLENLSSNPLHIHFS